MSLWQVQISGEGFIRRGDEASFESGGVVEAQNVDEAFATAVNIAKREHPELSQAEHSPRLGAVINADEIQELPDAPKELVGKIELYWSTSNDA